MAWPPQMTDWGAYVLRSSTEPAQQSHFRVKAEPVASYHQQQMQLMLSNMHATGHQARPRFVQSSHRDASVLLAHSQQTSSQVTHNHYEMHSGQRVCNSTTPTMSTDHIHQQIFSVDRSLHWPPQAPVPPPMQVDYDYDYNIPSQSPSYRDSSQLTYQAELQRYNSEEPAFRQIAMSLPPSLPSIATSARPSASFHTLPLGYDQTHISNNQLRAYDMNWGESPPSGHSLTVSPQHYSGILSVRRYGAPSPGAAPLVQSQFAAVERAVGCQECSDQTEWHGGQDNEHEQLHKPTQDNFRLPPPKRQRIETLHDHFGQLFTDQQILGPPACDQSSPAEQAPAQRQDHTPKTRLSETTNRASHAGNPASASHTCSQQRLERNVGIERASAQTQQKQFAPWVITVDDDQHIVHTARSTTPISKSGRQPILITQEQQQHVNAPAQMTIDTWTEIAPPKHHSPDQDSLSLINSSSPKQTEVPHCTSQPSPASILSPVAPVLQTPAPHQHPREDALLVGHDICARKLQAFRQTTPNARPKAPKRSRKKPSPPRSKQTPIYRPVVDAAELGILKLQSVCKIYVLSESAKRNTGPRNHTHPTLPQGTYRSSRHFRCTCAFPVPTCFDPEDPLGCPKLFEAEQRMEEANRGRDRCLEVRYIGARLPDRQNVL